MSYEIEWRLGAIEDITALFEYLAENASLWDARNVTERLITATDRLADYPRLYETDERYGEGVLRRTPNMVFQENGTFTIKNFSLKVRRINIRHFIL
ncbi:TPA: type II toxin-antitoxin system RelE/ParE family toxin [Escherichia coli]